MKIEFELNTLVYATGEQKGVYRLISLTPFPIYGEYKIALLKNEKTGDYINTLSYNLLSLYECADIITNSELQQLVLTYKK